MTFGEHLAAARGSACKARREYMRERRWHDDRWCAEWRAGLAVEVESAIRAKSAALTPSAARDPNG